MMMSLRGIKGTNLEILMRTTDTLIHFGIPAEIVAMTVGKQVDEVLDFSKADEPCCDEVYDICDNALFSLAAAMTMTDLAEEN